METNEFRVRPVTRFALTHYQEGECAGSSRTIGEFPNVEAAEEVGVALQALVPGSLLTTLEGRTPLYPPKALAAAMAVSAPPEWRTDVPASPALPARFPIGARVACVGYEHVVKSIKFTENKVFYGLAFHSNPDGFVIEYASDNVHPIEALGLVDWSSPVAASPGA